MPMYWSTYRFVKIGITFGSIDSINFNGFSPGTPVSVTKADRHDITEILLKVALNTTTIPLILTLYIAECILTENCSNLNLYTIYPVGSTVLPCSAMVFLKLYFQPMMVAGNNLNIYSHVGYCYQSGQCCQ